MTHLGASERMKLLSNNARMAGWTSDLLGSLRDRIFRPNIRQSFGGLCSSLTLPNSPVREPVMNGSEVPKKPPCLLQAALKGQMSA